MSIAEAGPGYALTFNDMAPISEWPVMFFWASRWSGITHSAELLAEAHGRLAEMEVLNGRGGMVAKAS